MKTPLTFEEILELIPQQAPFRFVDALLEASETHIVGQYRFKKEEFFYKGHFPLFPVTPGVILTETMAQIGSVAFGIYLFSFEAEKEEIASYRTFLTESQAEFFKQVSPEEQVTVRAEKVFWRKRKLKSTAEMFNEKGELVATCTLGAMGVHR